MEGGSLIGEDQKLRGEAQGEIGGQPDNVPHQL
jgi:hypothetical protein